MSTPKSSRYPRPLKATHALATSSGGGPSPSLSSQQQQTAGNRRCNSTPGAPAGRKAGVLSPDSPVTERVLVPLSGRGEGEEDEEVTENRRRANSLTSLADPGCCYGNLLWQRGPQPDQSLAPEGEGVGGESGATEDHNVPHFHGFSHKRSNSCSSADSLKTTPPVASQVRRGDDVHTRKSIEGLNQEVSSALEGVKIISPHQPPDGHIAPIRELLYSRPQSSPQFAVQSSPSSPLTHSTPSPSALGPSELPDTPTGFPRPPSSPSLSNPSFARGPPDGIECCLTTELTPPSSEILPIGPDKTKAKIVFQKSSAFLPASCRALTVNTLS